TITLPHHNELLRHCGLLHPPPELPIPQMFLPLTLAHLAGAIARGQHLEFSHVFLLLTLADRGRGRGEGPDEGHDPSEHRPAEQGIDQRYGYPIVVAPE